MYGFTGIGLDGVYVADQLHFHWGGDNDAGSEHTFDGQSYPMEVRPETVYTNISGKTLSAPCLLVTHVDALRFLR